MIDRDTAGKLMREAGFNYEDHYAIEGMLMRFAGKVAALVAAVEREACAAICDHYDEWGAIPRQAAAAIRSRGETK